MNIRFSTIVLIIVIVIFSVLSTTVFALNDITLTLIYGKFVKHLSNNTLITIGEGSTLLNISISNVEKFTSICIMLSVENETIHHKCDVINNNYSVMIDLSPYLRLGRNNIIITLQLNNSSLSYFITLHKVKPKINLELVNETRTLYGCIPQKLYFKIINKSRISVSNFNFSITYSEDMAKMDVEMINDTDVIVRILPKSTGKLSFNLNLTFSDFGNFNYTRIYTYIFTIIKTPVKIYLQVPKEVRFGQDIDMKIKLATPLCVLANESVDVFINNIYFKTLQTNNYGEAFTKYKPESIGNYIIKVIFKGSKCLEESVTFSEVKVISGIVNLDVHVNSTKLRYGETLHINVLLNPKPLTGYLIVKYKLENTSKDIIITSINESEVAISWKPPRAGNYELLVAFYGKPYYENIVKSIPIQVSKANCVIRTYKLVTGYVGQELKIYGKILTDYEKSLKLILDLNGTKYIISTNSSGHFNYVKSIFKAGSYRIKIYWNGDYNYNPCTYMTEIHVLKIPTRIHVDYSDHVIASGGVLKLEVQIRPLINTSLIPSGTLNIVINDSEILSEKLLHGKLVTYLTLWNVGDYELNITYLGDNYFEASSRIIKIKVIPGIYGIPWYVILIYIVPVVLGYITGIIMRKYLLT